MRFRSFVLAVALVPGVSIGQPQVVVPVADSEPDPCAEAANSVTDPDEPAEDAFQFTHPEPNSEIALDTYHAVRIQWLRGNRPVVGQTVSLRSDLGVIEDEVTTTGSNGVATFAIRSTAAGVANLRATTPCLDDPRVAQLVVRFSTTAASEEPFGDLAIKRTLAHQLPLWILTDRIGFLARGSVSIEDVARIAAAEGLTQLTPVGDGIFVLKVDHMPSVQDPERFLRERARRLEREHSEVFVAGLMAQIVGSRQWLVVPDQVIASFEDGLSEDEISNLVRKRHPSALIEPAGLGPGHYLITLDAAGSGALQIASELSSMKGQVVYAEPNYVIAIDLREDPATDQGYGYQWHHENDGTYGTADADIDSEQAWSYGYGSPDATIAVIDRGFDINHPDLVDNLVCDPTEWCANFGKRAINVTGADPDPTHLLSTSFSPETFSHGTRAAGVAAERGGNVIGYSGACPECRLMLIRNESLLVSAAKAFKKAIDKDVDVISSSWGLVVARTAVNPDDETPLHSLLEQINSAVGAGIPVVFAMTNEKLDNCGDLLDISCLPNVIGVSGITDYDERSKYNGEALGYGTGMDVLAPTRGGARGIRTTSVVRLQSGAVASAYWHDFSGTSAATPMVAGVIGLMKSLDPELSPLQIQRILQDTADRVDPQHANYSPESGFSDPDGTPPTHGYGRINAYEATRLVAPVSPRTPEQAAGRDGRDLVLRDHELDWGNTGQPSDVIMDAPRWRYTLHRSADIKVDVEPFQPFTNDPAGFVNLVSEEPEIGKDMQVFVRVRNRGPYAVQHADLKLHYARVSDTLPNLPASFWDSVPAEASVWTRVASKQLSGIQYSGASVAGCPARDGPECLPLDTAPVDAAQIATFMVPPLDWDAAAGQRIAFLAVVDSAQDPVQMKVPDVLSAVTQDNNVTLWTAAKETPECAPWIVPLIYVLLILAVILIVWIIWRWITGKPVAIGVYLALVLAIALLIGLRLAFPDCFATAMDNPGL